MFASTSPEFLAKIPLVLDNTILSTFRNCNHKALWEFVHDLRPGEVSIDLHAGACFAKAIETAYIELYAGRSRDDALARTAFAFDTAWGNFVPQKVTNKQRHRVWEAVESYIDRYNPPNDYIEPSKLFSNPFEYSFSLELTKASFGYDFPLHPATGDPFIYAGRFDMIGSQNGLLRIRDDKTTSALGASWDKQWTLRSQLLGYVGAMQILGYDVDTVEVRGIAILKESINHQAAVKSFTRAQVERWKWQLSRDVQNLVRAATSGEWEWNFSDICSQYGGCAFLDLCRAEDASNYFSSYAQRRWNPLERQKEKGAQS